MTDTPEEKKPRKKRSKEEIAADKRAWLAKHEWAGVRDAVALVADAQKAVEEAQSAAATKAVSVGFKEVLGALGTLHSNLSRLLPPEAR